jgi:hypothetical protein
LWPARSHPAEITLAARAPWADIDPVESAIDHFQLLDAHAGIRRLAPAAMARVLRPLRPGERMAILGALSGETVSTVLAASDPSFRRLLMTQLNHQAATETR